MQYKQGWNKDNVDVNVNNYLTKEYVIKDFCGILVIVNVNVINNEMLENIRLWQM